MSNLRVACIQPDIIWENITENITNYASILANIVQEFQPDLVLFPETFTTGFTSNVKDLAEVPDGRTSKWLCQQAAKNNTSLLASYLVKEKSSVYNRLVCANPKGIVQFYDKRHLFRMGEEEKYITTGNKHLILKIKDWKIMPLICYDLRFPVWSRNIGLKYDLLVYLANWPASRIDVWRTLLKARAIENQCYVAGVNRVGTDGQNINYSGETMIIDYKGQIISVSDKNSKDVVLAELSLDDLRNFRDEFPVYLDADDFEIK